MALDRAGRGSPEGETRWQRTTGGHEIGGPIRRALQRIVDIAQPRRRGLACAVLLDDVGQLMGEEPQTLLRFGTIASFPKDDMRADRVGPRADGPGGGGRPVVSVQAHVAEIAAEPRLHKGADGWFQRQTGRAQHFLNDCRAVIGVVVFKCHQ